MAYEDIVKRASEKYGVSEKLINAVIAAESAGNPNATSAAGAQGLMQLMPATAAGLGVKNPYDPEENIMGGTKYLADAIKNNNGKIDLALAAYNAGQGAVNKYGGVPPYAETQSYVKKIMSAIGNDTSTGEYTDAPVEGDKIDTTWWGKIIIIIATICVVGIAIMFLLSAFKK